MSVTTKTEDVHSYVFQVSSKVVAVAEETCFGRDSKFWLLVKSQNFKQLRDISLTPLNLVSFPDRLSCACIAYSITRGNTVW